MGATTTKVALFAADQHPLVEDKLPSVKGGHVLSGLIPLMDALLRSNSLTPGDVRGIGMALPASLSTTGNVLFCPNIDLHLDTLTEALHTKFAGARLRFANDADVALLAELTFGRAHNASEVVLLTLGTGVGGAIAHGGKVVVGAHGIAGEVGHIKVTTQRPRECGCGARGCLEAYASTRGVVESALETLADDKRPSLLRRRRDINARDIFDAARADDSLACEVVDDFADRLAFGLAQLACTLDPELFLIGGGLSYYEDVFGKQLIAGYRRYALPALRDTPILTAKLHNRAGTIGAALLVSSTASFV